MKTIMKIKALILIGLIISLGCQKSQNSNKSDKPHTINESQSDNKGFSTQSYAVVWDLTKGNTIENIIPIIQKQVPAILDLWRKGIIENAYVDNESKLNKRENYPNAFFVIKGKNEESVRSILNKTPAYIAGITKYKLYPIGQKWLKRNDKAMQKAQESKNSFAVVWKPIVYDKKYEQFTGEQSIEIMKLWNDGVIENAYLNVENIQEKDLQKPALVFFINAS